MTAMFRRSAQRKSRQPTPYPPTIETDSGPVRQKCYSCPCGGSGQSRIREITISANGPVETFLEMKCPYCFGEGKLDSKKKSVLDALSSMCQCKELQPITYIAKSHAQHGTDMYLCNTCRKVVQWG